MSLKEAMKIKKENKLPTKYTRKVWLINPKTQVVPNKKKDNKVSSKEINEFEYCFNCLGKGFIENEICLVCFGTGLKDKED